MSKFTEEEIKVVCDKLVREGAAEFLGYKLTERGLEPTYKFNRDKFIYVAGRLTKEKEIKENK